MAGSGSSTILELQIIVQLFCRLVKPAVPVLQPAVPALQNSKLYSIICSSVSLLWTSELQHYIVLCFYSKFSKLLYNPVPLYCRPVNYICTYIIIVLCLYCSYIRNYAYYNIILCLYCRPVNYIRTYILCLYCRFSELHVYILL